MQSKTKSAAEGNKTLATFGHCALCTCTFQHLLSARCGARDKETHGPTWPAHLLSSLPTLLLLLPQPNQASTTSTATQLSLLNTGPAPLPLLHLAAKSQCPNQQTRHPAPLSLGWTPKAKSGPAQLPHLHLFQPAPTVPASCFALDQVPSHQGPLPNLFPTCLQSDPLWPSRLCEGSPPGGSPPTTVIGPILGRHERHEGKGMSSLGVGAQLTPA